MPPAPPLYGRGHQPRETATWTVRPFVGGHLVLDFVNTASDHTNTPGDDDLAPGYVNLVGWSRQAEALTDEDATQLLRAASKQPREAAAVRKRALALREALHAIVLALTSDVEPAAHSLELFNHEYAVAIGHGGYVSAGSRLEWRWPSGPDVDLDRMLWPVCRSAADLLGGERLAKVRQCAAPGCQAMFLDGSKNGSRRFCSASGCGTAVRVQRFRDRHKPDP